MGKVRKGEIVQDSMKDLWATTPEHLSKEGPQFEQKEEFRWLGEILNMG